MTTNPQRGECEALRILRTILSLTRTAVVYANNDSALRSALRSGDALIRSLRLPPGQKQSGRPLTVTDRRTLRRIAALHAKGQNFSQIADRLRISRGNVRHHLKPSAAMLAACGL
jgi:DNA-binding CsgD family transcriptional regulator